MLYDGGNPLHAQQAKVRIEKLINDKKIFDLTEKKPRRSNQQNKYLHVILAYFGTQVGETMEYVKKYYYKVLVNPNTFIVKREDKYLGMIKDLRSSADLDSDEFSLSIDRFRNWASMECGIYLPSPEEEQLVQLMEIEIERNKEFI